MADGFLKDLEPRAPAMSPPKQETAAGLELPEQGSGIVAPQEEERQPEIIPEDPDVFLEEAPAPTLPADPVTVTVPESNVKDDVTLEVEKILEDGLGEFVQALSPEARAHFTEQGALVTATVSHMVRTFSLQVKKVMKLLLNWLQTLPGLNTFFLEQEAKLKTDRLLELERHLHEKETKTSLSV